MGVFGEIPGIKAEKKDSNVVGALAYLPVGGLLMPILIYLLSKEDRFVRFHALNAIGTYLAVGVAALLVFAFTFVFHILAMVLAVPTGGASIIIWAPVFLIIWLALMLAGVCLLIFMIYCMYLAYEGKAFSIPLVTDRIRKYV